MRKDAFIPLVAKAQKQESERASLLGEVLEQVEVDCDWITCKSIILSHLRSILS